MISLHYWSYFTPRSPEYDVRVKSSSSSPGTPGIKANFTPARNKHFKKMTDLQVTEIFQDSRYFHVPATCMYNSHNNFALPPCHIFNVTILCPLDMVEPTM